MGDCLCFVRSVNRESFWPLVEHDKEVYEGSICRVREKSVEL